MLKRKEKRPASINLLPNDDSEQSIVTKIVAWLLGTFRLMVICVELIVIVGFLSRFFLDSRNADLTDEINAKKALVESYLPFEREFRYQQLKIAEAAKLQENPSIRPLVADIASQLTEDVVVTEIVEGVSEVRIVAEARNEASIQSFISRLSQTSESLKNLTILSLEQKQNSQSIVANLVNSKAAPIE